MISRIPNNYIEHKWTLQVTFHNSGNGDANRTVLLVCFLILPSSVVSVFLAEGMFWSANIQERVPHVKQTSDPDTAQCPMSQGDKMIWYETMMVYFMKMWKFRKCRRANEIMASSEEVSCGTVGTNAKGKKTTSYLVLLEWGVKETSSRDESGGTKNGYGKLFKTFHLCGHHLHLSIKSQSFPGRKLL